MKALLLPGSAVWKDFLMENAAFFMGGHAIDDVMWKAGREPSPLFFLLHRAIVHASFPLGVFSDWTV